MATPGQWWAAARPPTLPAALAPVSVGTGAAAALGPVSAPRAVLAVVVALALQVGVNYANDYSDGVRGTDADRVGPFRITGAGAAPPRQVLIAALASFGVAAVAGTALVAVSAQWWLWGVGVVCVAAAWGYTGGARPYGYRGLGEVAVFVFFGLVAVLGTQLTQAGVVTVAGVAGACGVGSIACALLVANNLRDLAGDAAAGKRTLAVRLGDGGTRQLYSVLVAVPVVAVVVASFPAPGALLALLAVPLGVLPRRAVAAGATGRDLIAVLRATGRLALAYGVLLGVGLAL